MLDPLIHSPTVAISAYIVTLHDATHTRSKIPDVQGPYTGLDALIHNAKSRGFVGSLVVLSAARISGTVG